MVAAVVVVVVAVVVLVVVVAVCNLINHSAVVVFLVGVITRACKYREKPGER